MYPKRAMHQNQAACLSVLANDIALVANDDGSVPQRVAVHFIPLLCDREPC